MKRIQRPIFVFMFPIVLIAAVYFFAPQPDDPLLISEWESRTDQVPSTELSPPTSPAPTTSNRPDDSRAVSVVPTKDEQRDPSEQWQQRQLRKQRDTLFDALAKPLISEAYKRRDERRKSDPEYAKRVDSRLNEGRVNILLFGYGESHEPPATEKAIIGSHSIISYSFISGKADIVSFTHDIRGPEIEQALNKRGFKSPAVRIDQAYNVGGFSLQRKVFEDATGLSIDFQIVFKDSVLQNMVDQVFGAVDVEVPTAFKVYPFYLEGKKYPEGYFPKGAQKLNGTQVLQFIKTVPNTDGSYVKSLEHNERKHIILEGLLDGLNRRRAESGFWLKAAAFLTQQMVTGAVVYDFDPVTLVVKNVTETTSAISKFAAAEKSSGFSPPKINSSIYVVDLAHGDGGVQWVKANGAINAITQRDLDAGIYTSPDIEIPLNANPYGDLIVEYWPSVRELVRKTLAKNQP